jgi:hypothetical protein
MGRDREGAEIRRKYATSLLAKVSAQPETVRDGETRIILLFTQRGRLSEPDRGKCAARSRLVATAFLAFTQVDIDISVRWHTGVIIRRSLVRQPPFAS